MKTQNPSTKLLTIPGICVLAACLAPCTLKAQLVAYYTFDDSDIVPSTRSQTDQVATNNLIPTGTDGGTSIVTGQSGLFAQAYQFTRDAIGTQTDPSMFESLMRTQSAPIAASPTEFTVSLWFNRAANSPGQNKLFGLGDINLDGDATTAEGFDVGIEGGGIRIRNGGGFVTYGTGVTFLPGTASEGWHHLAVRINEGGATFRDIDLFLDGDLLTPVDLDTDIDFDDTLAMPETTLAIAGGRADAFLGEGFTGLMDEVRVFSNALTDEEITDLAVVPVIVEPEVTAFAEGSNGARLTAGSIVTFTFAADNAESLTLTGPTSEVDVTGQTTASVMVTESGAFVLTAMSSTGQVSRARLPIFVGAAVPEPIVFYSLDDANLSGAIVADLSGSGRNGQIFQTPGVTDVVTGQPGRTGEAFRFLPDSPGSDGIVDVPNVAESSNPFPPSAPLVPFGASERSISLFFNVEAVNGQNIVFQQGDAAGSFGIAPVTGGIAIRSGTNVAIWGQGFDWIGDDSGFRFLVVRVNPGAQTFSDVDVFVDGEQLFPAESPLLQQSLTTAAGLISIGGAHVLTGNDRDFAGLVDDFRIYDAALSSSEISEMAPAVPTILTFAPDQPGIRSNNQTLAWTTEDAVSLELNPGGLDVTGVTSATVSIIGDTTFTLTATGPAGDVISRSVVLFGGTMPQALVSYSFDNNAILDDGVTLVDGVGANNALLSQIELATFAIGQPGIFGQAVSFGGQNFVSSAVATGPAGVLPSGAESRTISIWFNQTTLALGANKFFGYGDEPVEGDVPSLGEGLDVSLEGGGIRIRFFGGNVTYGSDNDFVGANGGWHHVAIRVNDDATTFADVDIFLDGVQLPVTATGGAGLDGIINTNDSAFGMGNTSIAEDTSQTGLNGLIDRFMAFDGPLSGGEIAELAVMPPPAGAIVITAIAFDPANSELDYTLEVAELDTPYFLQGGPDLENLLPIPGSTFTPSVSPFLGSLAVDVQATPTFFLRVVEGQEP